MSTDGNRKTTKKSEYVLIESFGTYQIVRNKVVPKLPSGFYRTYVDSDGGFNIDSFFTKKTATAKEWDEFCKTLKWNEEYEDYFPIENYHSVLRGVSTDLDAFLSSRDFYTANDIQYRRSYLLFGDAGIGKTRFVTRLVNKLVAEMDAISIEFHSKENFLGFMRSGYQLFTAVAKDTLKVYVFDEFSEFTDIRQEDTKSEVSHQLLRFLDNPHNNDNSLFFFCTNHPESIPDNIIDRPSRIDMVYNIGLEGFDREGFIRGWYEFIMKRPLPDTEDTQKFITQTNIITPAHLKELFVYSYQRNITLWQAYELMCERKRMIESRFKMASEKKGSNRRAGF